MFNQVIPTMNYTGYYEEYREKYLEDEIEIFLEKICLCGMCNNNDKTDKKQIFKCPHYCCGCADSRRWCLMCSCDIKR